MSKFEMEYNSQREDLVISEYGRHAQNLIRKANEIADPEKRQYYVEEMVNLLNIINPSNKTLEGYQEKMWNHVFRIADYNLDVKVPEGIKITKPEEKQRPERLPYPENNFRFRHYGHFTLQMIDKACALEDEDKKQGYMKDIAAYMKLAYRTWNKEHYVNDDTIKQELANMSKGKLVLGPEVQIEDIGYNAFPPLNAPRSKKNKGYTNAQPQNFQQAKTKKLKMKPKMKK